MNKTFLTLFLMSSFVVSLNGATRYISNNLYTYMHAGPGNNFKIIGSVNAGKKVKFLKVNQDTGFTQITDQKGRIGWIKTKHLSKQPGLQARIDKLENKLNNISMNLSTSKDTVDAYSTQIQKLENTNGTLKQELERVQSLNNELNEKLDNEKTDLLIKWFTYGGMVGGVGLLLGLILPSMIPNRKKRNRW